MIPFKLFSRLCTSLVEQRINPCNQNDLTLLADEMACDWPQNASAEQLKEWQDIHDRTRAEFDKHVGALHSFCTE
jgi:hypothetical protein